MAVTIPSGVEERLTAHQMVYATLRSAIVNGQLSVGTRIVQAEVATHLNVSTTPVREALRDLATEGLIDLDAHRGAVVRDLQPSEARDIYNVRLLVEPEAMARVAVARPQGDLQPAANLQHEMDSEDDPVAWSRLNLAFHSSLTDLVPSYRMAAIIRNLQDAAAVFVSLTVSPDPDRMRSANEEHANLLEAIEQQDADQARLITQGHLRTTLERIERD